MNAPGGHTVALDQTTTADQVAIRIVAAGSSTQSLEHVM